MYTTLRITSEGYDVLVFDTAYKRSSQLTPAYLELNLRSPLAGEAACITLNHTYERRCIANHSTPISKRFLLYQEVKE